MLAYRQHKLEQFECLKVHCYPVTEAVFVREAPFNMVRAQMCAKECNKTMTEIEAYQQAALSRSNQRMASCKRQESWLSSKDPAYDACIREILEEEVALVNVRLL